MLRGHNDAKGFTKEVISMGLTVAIEQRKWKGGGRMCS